MLGLIYKLQQIMNRSFDQKDVMVLLATYFLENLDQKESMSIKSIAEDCNVSPGSITRFAKELGYNGFIELKRGLLETDLELEELKIDLDIARNIDKNDYVEEIHHGLLGLAESEVFSDEYLNNLAKVIHEADKIHFFATMIPGYIVEIFQQQLLTTGKKAYFYPLACDQQEHAKHISQNDLVFYVSLSGSYVSKKDVAFDVLNSESTNYIITQIKHVRLSQSFDGVIQLGNWDHEIIGKYKFLMFVEILMKRYLKLYG